MQTYSGRLPKKALTEPEAARYIGMSSSFLRRSRMEGNRKNRTPAPPFIKIGRSVRYIKQDLDSWLDEFIKLEHLGQAQKRRTKGER